MKQRAENFSDTAVASARRASLLNILFLLSVLACYVVAGTADADDDYLGQLSANPYDANSTSNPFGVGSPYNENSINNPNGEFGSPYSNKSATNPYATDAPKLYDADGRYRGRLSANPYDADSTSNPYGRYGSRYSPDSINNPYGAGNPYSADSPTNPYGNGLSIYAGDSEGPGDHDTDDPYAPTADEALESDFETDWLETDDY